MKEEAEEKVEHRQSKAQDTVAFSNNARGV